MDNFTTTSETSDWQKNPLWVELQNKKTPESGPIRTTLNLIMPTIQKVLAQGGTAPNDFTLHDSGHAFRVAKQMVKVIPPDVMSKLSSYELALLLLSAYLHDIGMTPEQRKVTQLYNYLLTGEPQNLLRVEKEKFQEWLDNEGYDVEPPISQGQPNVQILRLAGELITHYCRHRHNDWSEEWIRKYLSNHQLGNYKDWIEDLVTLCRSHHQGYQDLVKDKFNPRIVSSPSEVVHIRYLACVLRIADILDFDPERTPNVILRHRDISPDSLIYWWKNHEISMIQEDNRLVVSARPSSAPVHRAIEVTLDQIDEELRLCRTLADETHFEKCPGLAKDLPHRWVLMPSVHRNITPREENYEYIDGAFRPNTQKLLELLSGNELYGFPLVAVRELLQNAFDAVREQIAYQRLLQPNPSDQKLAENLGKLHRVELRLETYPDDGAWLMCSDTGVGMTKAIIKDHLLVSGVARRHDVLALERKCKEAGFSLGRTGQFGIGVLSYFMLADRLIIKTKRSQEPGDAEQSGWYFETEGVGSFGELRRDTSIQRGSQIRLHLRSDVIGDPVIWFSNLRSYLENILVYIPFEFQLNTALPECEALIFQPNWVTRLGRFSAVILRELKPRGFKDDRPPAEILSIARKKEFEAKDRYWKELRDETKEHLRWRVQEGDLPNGLGCFRIHQFYFELADGASLGFLRVRNNAGELLMEKIDNRYDAYIPDGQVFMGWKGIKVYAEEYDFEVNNVLRSLSRHVIVEINWNSNDAGKVMVNRNEFKLSKKAQDTIIWLNLQASKMGRTFLEEHKDSTYAAFNCRVMNSELQSENNLNWLSFEGEQKPLKASWRPLTFPLINHSSIDLRIINQTPTWKGKSVTVVPNINALPRLITGLSWNPSNLAPDRVMICQDPVFKLLIRALWTQPPKLTKPGHIIGMTCRFPPEWRALWGVIVNDYSTDLHRAFLWNKNHPIIREIDEKGWGWCLDTFKISVDPLPHKKDVLKNKSRAVAWVVRCLQDDGTKDIWEGLIDRDSSFLTELWQIVFESHSKSRSRRATSICLLEDIFPSSTSGSQLHVLTPEKWVIYTKENDIERYLPDPGPEWQLVVK